MPPYELVVVGASWGGLQALGRLLSDLPHDFDLPVVVAQHRHPDSLEGTLRQLLQRQIQRARPCAPRRGAALPVLAEHDVVDECGRRQTRRCWRWPGRWFAGSDP